MKLQPYHAAIAATLCLTLGATVLQAEQWADPRPRKVYSQNRAFIAIVQPAGKDKEVKPEDADAKDDKKGKRKTPAGAVVYALPTPGLEVNPRRIWATALTNPLAPFETKITEDGRHLITLDNWAGIGRGEEVLAFYNSQGQIESYSLEKLLDMPKIPEDFPGIRHTEVSRHWRQHAVEVMDQRQDSSFYCIWLHHSPQWRAFEVSTGRRVPVSPQYAAYLNEKGVASMRSEIQRLNNGQANDSLSMRTTIMFLGTLRRNEDRQMFNALMFNDDFRTESIFTEINGQELPVFWAESSVRRIADRIFAFWEGKLPQNKLFGNAKTDPYFYLGRVTGTFELPEAPTRESGSVHIYLIPAKADIRAWATSKPTHKVTVKIADSILGGEYNYVIDGVMPGQYRVKVVWDKSEPFTAARDGQLAAPGKGDFDNKLTRNTINVRARGTTKAGVIKVDEKH